MSAGSARFYPIAFGEYADHEDLPAAEEVAAIVDLLGEFNTVPVAWDVAMPNRGRDAVDARLTDIQNPSEPADTFLYWLGHGWSDNLSAALAHALSPADFSASGIRPSDLAATLTKLQSHRHAADRWAIVVIDACRSAQFVRLLSSELDRSPVAPRRLLLVGTSGLGSARLGEFRRVLEHLVNNTFRANDIRLIDLMSELERALPEDAEVRAVRVADAMLQRRSAVPYGVSLDVFDQVKAALNTLSTDEQRHFIPKAQGAELGEIAWYFEGRTDERRTASLWLREAEQGLLVVTGPAGTGKSALLGHLVEQSRPGLRDLLIAAGLIDSVPDSERPPDDVFDLIIHLTGVTPEALLDQLNAGFGFTAPALEQSIDARMNGLVRRLETVGGRRTILLDALDEAQHPLVMARDIIRRLGQVPEVRVLVGTRASTLEDPDRPSHGDRALLDALGPAHVLSVGSDPAAVSKYVSKRLRARLGDDDPLLLRLIGDLSARIGESRRQFLFARLAVHELLSRPDLIADSPAVVQLLASDHRELFTMALDRLTAIEPAFGPLLEALGLSMGRGMPIRDGVWLGVARALGPGQEITEAHIDRLLRAAAPYLTVDIEHDQTVYRLAHATFAEHYGQALARHYVVAQTLIEQAEAAGEVLNPYVRTYLPRHAALGWPGTWSDLALQPWTLDRLDPVAVATNAMAVLFGRHRVPPEIAGVIAAQHLLVDLPPSERLGYRQLAMAQYSHVGRPRGYAMDVEPPWSVRWARFTTSSIHLTLSSQLHRVSTLIAMKDEQDRVVLAIGGRHLHFWDPLTSRQIGDALAGHGRVRSMTLLADEALLVSGHQNGAVIAWSPAVGGSGARIWREPRRSSILALVAHTGPDGRRLLAVGTGTGTIHRWDPGSGEPVGEPLAGHTGAVRGLAVFTGRDGRELVASGGDDQTLRIWDMSAAEPAGEVVLEHDHKIYTVVAFERDGRPLLVLGGLEDGLVIWDPWEGAQFGDRLLGHTGPVWDATVIVNPQGRQLLVSVGNDRAIRFWDIEYGREIRRPLTGHAGAIRAVTAFPGDDGRTLLATAGSDSTVRIWDPWINDGDTDSSLGDLRSTRLLAEVIGSDGRPWLASLGPQRGLELWDTSTVDDPIKLPLAHRSGRNFATVLTDQHGTSRLVSSDGLNSVRVLEFGAAPAADPQAPAEPSQRPRLATGDTGGSIVIWNAADGSRIPDALADADLGAGVSALTTFAGPTDERFLAAGSTAGTMRFWSLASGEPTGEPVMAHKGRVLALTTCTGPDHPILASGGADGLIHLWNPYTRERFGDPLTGHPGPVQAVTTFQHLLAAGSPAGTIHCWDLTTGRPTGEPVTAHKGRVLALTTCTGPDHPILASGGADGLIRLWNPYTREPLGDPLTGHSGQVQALTAFTGPDGRPMVASGGTDETVRIWDVESGRQVGKPLTGHTGGIAVLSAWVNAEGRTLVASASNDGTVRIWDSVSGLQLGEPLAGHPGPVRAATAFDLRATLHTAQAPRARRFGQPAQVTYRRSRFDLADAHIRAIKAFFSAEGRAQLAVGGSKLAVWSLFTGTHVATFSTPSQSQIPVSVSDLAVIPRSGAHPLLAAVYGEHRTEIWDLATGQRLKNIGSLGGRVTAVTGIPSTAERPLLATTSANTTLRIWDVTAPTTPVLVLESANKRVTAAFAATATDGRTLLVTGGNPGAIQLWDLDTGLAVKTIHMPAAVTALARTSHGLAVATEMGLVELVLPELAAPELTEPA